MDCPEKEVLRYLGVRGAPDGRLSGQIRQLTAELETCVTPKSVCGFWDCRAENAAVELADLLVTSEHLARHLRDCRRAALLAATLGTGADTLIRRYSVLDMGKAVIAHAVSAALIERYCGDMERDIAGQPEADGFSLTKRFSPGYGDFALLHQKDILRLLDGSRRIGLTLTDGYMLSPAKSVTAVIGLREIPCCF